MTDIKVERTIYVGCAGWSIRTEHRPMFAEEGSHLERYASVFNAVEINSSFYKPHRRETYQRWGRSVPEGFRFSVKVPRILSHEGKLRTTEGLPEFIEQVSGLDAKLGPLLLQLPPSLSFDAATAGKFFESFRDGYEGVIVCEPRHISWLSAASRDLLEEYAIRMVDADPNVIGKPAGEPVYHRLHGSPKVYYSAYSEEVLRSLADSARASPGDAWYIFDNTAVGHAVTDALGLKSLLRAGGGARSRRRPTDK